MFKAVAEPLPKKYGAHAEKPVPEAETWYALVEFAATVMLEAVPVLPTTFMEPALTEVVGVTLIIGKLFHP